MKTFFSPAKINLFLHVHRKRTDGYHDLSSLFQTVDLYDTLHLSLSTSDLLTCNDPNLPTNSSNLVSKAVALFRAKTDLKFCASIHLEKKIPQEAGLGGGSSNAATTLWALNKLLNTNIPIGTLKLWAAELGSDVPFFLTSGTAFCTGRGEIMVDRSPIPSKTSLTLVTPPFGMSTQKVFQNLDLAALPQRNPEIDLIRMQEGEFVLYNDLEAAAFSMNPKLKQLKQMLFDCGYSHVCMTGSGSTFFCFGNGNGAGLQSEGCRLHTLNFINRPGDLSWYGE